MLICHFNDSDCHCKAIIPDVRSAGLLKVQVETFLCTPYSHGKLSYLRLEALLEAILVHLPELRTSLKGHPICKHGIRLCTNCIIVQTLVLPHPVSFTVPWPKQCPVQTSTGISFPGKLSFHNLEICPSWSLLEIHLLSNIHL